VLEPETAATWPPQGLLMLAGVDTIIPAGKVSIKFVFPKAGLPVLWMLIVIVDFPPTGTLEGLNVLVPSKGAGAAEKPMAAVAISNKDILMILRLVFGCFILPPPFRFQNPGQL
jgi:hypothetical protein